MSLFTNNVEKLSADRKNYFDDLSNVLISKPVNCKRSFINVMLERVFKISSSYSVLEFSCSKEKTMGIRSGDSLLISYFLDGRYYSKIYPLVSTFYDSLEGIYKILVPKDDSYVNNLRIGDFIKVKRVVGNLYYSNIVSLKNVLFIASDMGIAKALSFMHAIIDGSEDFNMTLLYSCKSNEDILFKDELDDIVLKSNIKVNYVCKDNGDVIDYEMLSKYLEDKDTSVFVSGNEGLCKYIDKELLPFNIAGKYVRYDKIFPKSNIRKSVKYKLFIFINGEKIEVSCYNNRTLTEAILESGIYIPSNMSYTLELLKGEVKIINDNRSSIIKKYNYIIPNCTYPLSDIELVIR